MKSTEVEMETMVVDQISINNLKQSYKQILTQKELEDLRTKLQQDSNSR